MYGAGGPEIDAASSTQSTASMDAFRGTFVGH